MKISDIPMECPECGWKGGCGDCELGMADGWFTCPKCLGVVKEIKMMPKTKRDEFLAFLANAKQFSRGFRRQADEVWIWFDCQGGKDENSKR